MRDCDACGVPCQFTAICDEFMEQPEWSFWGERGGRWVVCRNNSFVHFKVMLQNGRLQHRLCFIRKDDTRDDKKWAEANKKRKKDSDGKRKRKGLPDTIME